MLKYTSAKVTKCMPVKPGKGTIRVTVHVQMPPELAREMRMQIADLGMTKQGWARNAIVAAIERGRRKTKPEVRRIPALDLNEQGLTS